MIDDPIGTTEAAKILELHPNRVRELVKEGRFPGAVMVAGRVMIPRREVEAFKAQERKPGRPPKRDDEMGRRGGWVSAAC